MKFIREHAFGTLALALLTGVCLFLLWSIGRALIDLIRMAFA